MATAEERAQAHWTRLQQAILQRPDRTVRWSDRGISFVASQPFLTSEGKGVGMTIAASDMNGPLPTDNPYVFYNPPLGVVVTPPVVEWDTDTHTWVVVTPAVIDSSEPLQAAKAMVYDIVTIRARQLGWGG